MTIDALKSTLLDLVTEAVVIAQLPDGSHDGSVVYANAAFLRLSGRDGEDLTGTLILDLFDLGPAVEACVTKGAIPLHQKLTITRRDGGRVATQAILRVERAPADDGRLVSVMCQCPATLPASLTKVRDEKGEYIEKIIQERDHAIKEHERLTFALNAYPDPFVIYDESLVLISWNVAYAASMSDDPSALRRGMTLREVLFIGATNGRYPAAVGREEEWINEILSHDTLTSSTQDVELENGTHYRLYRYRSENGDYVVIRLNSTELVQQKRVAESAQARLLAALNAYPAPFVIYDPNDCIVVWNDAYSDTMNDPNNPLQVGMHRTEVARIAINAGKIVDAADDEDLWKSISHQNTDLQKPVQDLELPGDIHQRLLRSRVENGDFVIVRIDTTELVRQRRSVERYAKRLEVANQEISHQAFHDDLTGLGNRRHLKRQFEAFKEQQKTGGGEIAALHIDLDRFKQINDTMGHAAGDRVLKEASKRILGQVGPDDVLARIGGDEFVVLTIVKEDSLQPETIATDLIKDLSEPVLYEDKECRFGASIGMAITPLSSVDQLLINSDIALYKAKRQGRGRLAIFDQCDLEKLRHDKQIADEILDGIEQREFIPYFQPQVDARTHVVVGIEVLARWDHPARGILAPDAFLSVATDLDVVADIDKMVFESAITACTTAFAGMADVPSLSFNVSASRVNTFRASEFQQHIRGYPGRVAFELLETIFLEEEETEFFWMLDQLRSFGIDIEIDDFGSGRASVVALQRINPDRIKIDRRLVAPITISEGGLQLLRSIVEIGHAMEMGVTAEGVETPEQAELLAELGVDRLQGYYFSKPIDFNALQKFLSGANVMRLAGGM